MRNKLITIFLCIVTVSVPLSAHHGAAAYDTAKKITVKGTVTEWFWANPHCFLKFDAKVDKGNVVHWATETSNPSDMVNLGWSRQTFKPGDEVTVTFIPVKNGQPVGRPRASGARQRADSEGPRRFLGDRSNRTIQLRELRRCEIHIKEGT